MGQLVYVRCYTETKKEVMKMTNEEKCALLRIRPIHSSERFRTMYFVDRSKMTN